MKTVLIAILCVFAGLPQQVHAKQKNQKANKLSTQVDFDDRLVGGKYQYSTEAITKVEDDKSLDDLIGVRKNFNDKNKQYKDLR